MSITTAPHQRARTLVVVGTDTGVGKTLVGRALASAHRRAGRKVRVLKPAESGCPRGPDGALVPEDAVALARAAGDTSRLDEICPYAYALPVAPGVAAAQEGNPPELDDVLALWTTATAQADLVLIEGAGGLLVPMGSRTLPTRGTAADSTQPAPGPLLWADWLVRFGAPVILVGRSALGTINHTLLTIEALAARGLACKGVILNRTQQHETPDERGNGDEIVRHGGVPLLATFPYLSETARRDDQQLAELAGTLGLVETVRWMDDETTGRALPFTAGHHAHGL
jgi:dethiobiotin synthetase